MKSKTITCKKIELRNVDYFFNNADLNSAVDKILEDETRKNKSLFNGDLFQMIGYEKKDDGLYVKGSFIEYKYFVAQLCKPELNLNIKPVGVCGGAILKERGKNYFLFAERSDNLSIYPSHLELIPSGCIDKSVLTEDNRIDYVRKLENEFFEETGWGREVIKDITPLCLIFDKDSKIYDVACIMELIGNKNNLASNFKSEEYKELLFVDTENIIEFTEKNRQKIISTSLAIIEQYTKLKQNE